MVFFTGAAAAAASVNFENLSLPDGESAWSGEYPVDGVGGTGATSRFFSGPAAFVNFSDGDWSYWEGFAYSNMSDTVNGAYENQFSAYPGSGIDAGDDIYAVGYAGFSVMPAVEFEGTAEVTGAYFANTTHTALTMLNGNSFAKKFGGAAGLDPDWLRLTITGRDSSGSVSGSVDFLLADYSFGDSDLDYVLDRWQYVDLTGLGKVSKLEFFMASSDSGPHGMNTPAYFAMDGLIVVPEPAGLLLLAAGIPVLQTGGRRLHKSGRKGI
jgi:hypothetical protein